MSALDVRSGSLPYRRSSEQLGAAGAGEASAARHGDNAAMVAQIVRLPVKLAATNDGNAAQPALWRRRQPREVRAADGHRQVAAGDLSGPPSLDDRDGQLQAAPPFRFRDVQHSYVSGVMDVFPLSPPPYCTTWRRSNVTRLQREANASNIL